LDTLYPLLFEPLFKERVWGGRGLAPWFPALPPGPIGEAWVLGDHAQGRTRVKAGPLAGEILGALLQRFGAQLVGPRGMAVANGQFPLLVKLLDAQADLSVQVHPTDSYPGLPPGELGKTEMWLVLAADPGARVVYGLAEGTTPAAFADAIASSRTMAALRQLAVQAGDVLYVPAGTIHALGAGLVVAEIQQSSDTVYRVYDYDRPGLDGNPRALHIRDALAVTQYGPPPQPTRPRAAGQNHWHPICASPFFVVSLADVHGEWAQPRFAESFEVILPLDGAGEVRWDGGRQPLPAGEALLIPAVQDGYSLAGDFRALHVTLP